MKTLRQNRIIGFFIVLVSFAASFLSNSIWLGVPCGAVMAVGVGLILNWIPFKKPNL